MGVAMAAPMLADANDAAALSGIWRSAPDETPLASAFDVSVWGKNAKAVRTVEMVVGSTGNATLTVTRRVVDARGRTVPASTSIDKVDLVLGAAQRSIDVRSDLTVGVKHAERRYPDDPGGTWTVNGLKASVSTFSDDPRKLEVRIDMPDGRDSFWATLRRSAPRRSP
jgi:Flp pilus assembly protein TadG